MITQQGLDHTKGRSVEDLSKQLWVLSLVEHGGIQSVTDTYRQHQWTEFTGYRGGRKTWLPTVLRGALVNDVRIIFNVKEKGIIWGVAVFCNWQDTSTFRKKGDCSLKEAILFATAKFEKVYKVRPGDNVHAKYTLGELYVGNH